MDGRTDFRIFFFAKAFKINLKVVFLFALFVGFLSTIILSGQTNLLLLYAAFNYIIQLFVLIINIKNKLTIEQGLFSIYFFGGIGSLLAVWLFSYAALEIYLLFYYCILILASVFGNKVNTLRDNFL